MKTPTILCSLAALAFSLTANAQTATTAPVGFSNLAAPVGTSLVVPTLNNASVFTGSAAISSNGLTITPPTSPGWTAGAYAATSFASPTPNYPTHYAEVTSGPQEGLVIDISTNSAAALTVLADEITVASGLRGTTVQIAIRQHMTVDKVIQGATGMTAFSDSFSVYNSNGSQTICNFDGTSFLDRDFTLAVGHTIIYPGTGFVCSVSNPVTFTFIGSVKTTKTQIPLFAGATNIVGPQNPASSTLLYGNSLATVLEPFADGVNNYSSNGQMTATPYASNGTQILDRDFTPLPSNAADAIALNRGVVITVGSDKTWVVNSPIPAP
jgi:hypothetical protein